MGKHLIDSDEAFKIMHNSAFRAGIERYLIIMRRQRETRNISTDQNFIKTFETFYKLGRYPKGY